MRAAWVDKNPKAAKALLMAVMEAQQWCDKMENKDEMAAIIAKRQWINVPVDRHRSTASRATSITADGRVVKNSRPADEVLGATMRPIPFQSHDLWFLTEDIRWGKFDRRLDTKALIAKVNREDLWRDAAKDLGVAASDIPASTVARQGDLLRRQGVRSGESGRLSEVACPSSA